MIDYNRFTYTKIGSLSNVVFRRPKLDPLAQDATPVISTFMEPLITKLALAHPEWTLVGAGECSRIMTFTILQDNEQLGTIEQGSRYTRNGYAWEPTYKLRSRLLDGKRTKCGPTKTSDLKKAIKLVEENFVARTLTEQVRTARSLVSPAVREIYGKRIRTFNDTMERLRKPLALYIRDNIEQVSEALVSYGVSPESVAKVPDVLLELEAGKELNDALEAKVGVAVYRTKDNYMLWYDGATDPTPLMASSDIPPHIRGNLAILQMVEGDNEFVEGVGVRISGTTFYLYGKG